MTIGAEVKQTLASLKGVQATVESFALFEENAGARSVFDQNARKIKKVILDMEKRLSVLEFEEPQYKGF